MVPTFGDADAADRHQTQYFEVGGNRGIYHQGWTAVTKHSTPWVMTEAPAGLDDDTWELYGPDDWTQARNTAAEQPEELQELQRLFVLEASRYGVFPAGRSSGRAVRRRHGGPPQLVRGTSQTLFGGMAPADRSLGAVGEEPVRMR